MKTEQRHLTQFVSSVSRTDGYRRLTSLLNESRGLARPGPHTLTPVRLSLLGKA